MTNDGRSPKPEALNPALVAAHSGIRASDFIRHSSFVIRPFLLSLALAFFPLALPAQSNSVINVSGGRLIIAQPGGGQLVITGQTTIRFQNGQMVLGPGAGAQLDPQIAAAMQFSGNEQLAQAEFDPPVVPLGQPATYRVVITAMPEGASLPETLPAPRGLTLAPGGHGFLYGIGNGAMQPRSTFNFRVTAATNGVYFVPAFEASANGKSVTVPEAMLSVLPGDMPPSERSARLVVEPAPGEFYIGQNVPVNVVLLDPGDNSVAGMGQVQVSGEAFVAEGGPRSYRRQTRIEDGRPATAQVAELWVTPIKEGRLSLVAQAAVVLNRPPRAGGITLPGYQPLLDSEPAFVTVKHLPRDGELPGFTGGIGQFSLDPPRLSATELRAGDPLMLTVVVRGAGNFSRLVPPKLAQADGWQVFTPSVGAAPPPIPGMPGAATFTYSLIPLSSAVTTTPKIAFSYFDPVKQAYVDLSIPPMPVKVTGGDAAAARLAQSRSAEIPDDTEREPVMAGLAGPPRNTATSLTPVQQQGWFLALQLLPLGALSGLWAWDRRRRFLAAHPEVVRRRRALRGIRREWRRARRAASARDAAGFVAASVNALREAAAPHTAAEPQALVCADVLAALAAGGRNGDDAQLVRYLFVASEEKRFLSREPETGAVLGLRGQVEELLEAWRMKL